jgi:(p)ppGpp synthase/HD superfamily hydrolase
MKNQAKSFEKIYNTLGKKDKALLLKAYNLAKESHQGQLRKS